MKIVVLDGHTANPGDLSWAEFAKFGELTVHDRTAKEQIIDRLQGAQVAITNKVALDRELIHSLETLRYISIIATGYNIVDVAAARERGIAVSNVPEYSTTDVAQAAFALLLELTNRVGHHAETVRAGRWAAAKDFCYWDFPLISLSGLTLGIVGYGRIGQAVANLGRAFGMKTIALRSISKKADTSADVKADVTFVELETLLAESDVVSLHCPLTPKTAKFINDQTLALMKPTAFLLNTARGGLIDEASLAAALNTGRLAGAGLDVLSIEPPAPSNPLLTAKNCIITPHVAWATKNSRARLLHIAAGNIQSWLDGSPRNLVNP